jgi:hypothetical protein
MSPTQDIKTFSGGHNHAKHNGIADTAIGISVESGN